MEIKFRGKRLDNGEFAYGYYVVEYGEHLIKTDMGMSYIRNEVDPNTVGQYTGLKDKNGKELFEGDVILYNNIKRKIIYNEFAAAFMVVRCDCGLYPARLSEVFKNVEIIGNIWEATK